LNTVEAIVTYAKTHRVDINVGATPSPVLRILFDKNVPGARRFVPMHEVRTVVEMEWPDQLENGELLRVAEEPGFDYLTRIFDISKT